MRASSDTIRSRNSGFTLVELLVVTVIAGIMLSALTVFYVSQQRAGQHHRVEIESSQALRTALEEISRDLRSAGRNLTGAALTGVPFVTADTSNVEFKLDANDDGAATASDPNEHKGFRLTATTLETLDAGANAWSALADNVSSLQFTYRNCSGSALTAPVASPGAGIASVDISLTVSRTVIGDLPLTRTETDSVRLRNKKCP